ncbi:uncharacterized protein LOC123886320 [Trifolium pratense]|uniref:uncharacterized protein LOC123886320 n=1 Tax=Trifolium pratense TaxID=57577 RepID=UPI001E69321C|nr:uncharacterized protein LOC123886320 [Trifolium pratense]
MEGIGLRNDRSPFSDAPRFDHDHCRNPRHSHSRDCYRARRDSWMKQRWRSCSVFPKHYRYQTADKTTGRRQYADDRSQQEFHVNCQRGGKWHRRVAAHERNDGMKLEALISRDGVKAHEGEGLGCNSEHEKHRLRKRGNDNLGTELKRYVSFYFTNFPYQLSNFYLRKGFKVCGMLEDVFLPKKRNRRGQPFGFVKFSNVRDVNKLLRALNKVNFGQFCVRARVASFDRYNYTAGQRMEKEWPSLSKGNDRPALREGRAEETRTENLKANGGCIEPMGTSVQKRAARDVDPDRGGSGESGAVRVGEVVVPLGARNENVMCVNDQVQKGAHTPSIPVLPEVTVKKIYLPSYKTEPDDVAWAQNGLVATIINGEAVPVVQSRIMDAGFNDVIIIPMGADKVFVRSSSGIDVKAIIDSAKEFFQIIFSSWTSWESHAQDYRRGAWVHLYGIPLQAWNENFFKLCVLDCGRFLRVEYGSVEKERIDFARVLIATPNLEIVNTVATVLVDGIQFEVKIVEEWGYTLGEDNCLFEEDNESVKSHSDHDEGQGDPEVRRHLDTMVENFAKGMEAEDDIGSQDNFELSHLRGGGEGGSKNVGEFGVNFPSRGEKHVVRGTGCDSVISPFSKGIQGSISICSPVNGSGRYDGNKGSDGSFPTLSNGNRAKSCPPGATRSMLSGPWS